MTFSVLVTGANRGIGLELVRQLACGKKPADFIFATCRSNADCQDLNEIKEKCPNLHILHLDDVRDEASYGRLVREVSDVVQDAGLTVLINNAGMSGVGSDLLTLTSDDMVNLFSINCVAPLMLTKAFLPLLRAAAANPAFPEDAYSWRRAAVLNISSLKGSIDDNRSGRGYAYRSSKVALNAVTRSLGIDLRHEHILSVSMDPGWVRTRLGGPNGMITTEESATRILATMEKLGRERTASYINNLGEPIPW